MLVLRHTLDLSLVVFENLKDGQLAEANLLDVHQLKVSRVLNRSLVVVPGQLGLGRSTSLALHHQNVALVDGFILKEAYKGRRFSCDDDDKKIFLGMKKKEKDVRFRIDNLLLGKRQN